MKVLRGRGTLTRGKDFAIPAEPEGIDGICVAFEFSNHQSVTNVPQKNSAVSGSRGQKLTIGRESQRMDRTLGEKVKRMGQ